MMKLVVMRMGNKQTQVERTNSATILIQLLNCISISASAATVHKQQHCISTSAASAHQQHQHFSSISY